MPTEAHEALWAEASERLRELYGDERFERWIAPLRVLSSDGPEILLAVANEFMRDFIEDHYSDRITEALNSVDRRSDGSGREGGDGSDGGRADGTRGLSFALKVAPALFSEVKREEHRIFNGRPPPEPLLRSPRARRPPAGTPTLETFVVGVSNHLGYNAALQILECPGRHYNPLFVHGVTGVGKTHLLKALARAFRAAAGDVVKRIGRPVGDGAPRVEYLTAEEFTNQFLQSLAEKSLGRFRQRFRSLDVLLVDDIQVLAGKKKTQEEFLHTFNALVDSGRQVVLGGEVSPSRLPSFPRPMVTRFMSGLVVGLKRPDLATRVGILQHRAGGLGRRFETSVLETVAGTIRGNAHELIGALKKLDIHARVDDRPLGVERARDILAEFLHENTRPVRAPRILQVVASYYGLASEDLLSKSRQRTVVHARRVAMYLTRRFTGKSLAEVGALFGGRSHATAKTAESRIAARLRTDTHFVEELDAIVERLEKASDDGAQGRE